MAVSVKQYTNELKQLERKTIRKNSAPGWIKQLEHSNERIQKEIAQLNVMIECKKTNTYSKHQLKLKQLFTKRYGDFRLKTLQFKLSILYQNLKAKSTKLKYNKRCIKRKSINNKFRKNSKAVYRSKKGNNINATEIPTTEDIESFWKNIWGKESNFHKEAEWIKNLEKNYFNNIRQQPYKITDEILNKAVSKLFLGKSPGRDLIKGYWYKRLIL